MMKISKFFIFILIILLTVTLVAPSYPVQNENNIHKHSPGSHQVLAQSQSHLVQGQLTYRVRGPAPYAYGYASGTILAGAGLPLATARIANLIDKLSLISRFSDDFDASSFSRISELAHQGIPFDLASTGITGAYTAQVNFYLEEDGDHHWRLHSGTVDWSGYNKFEFGEENLYMADDFSDSGSHRLDPEEDKINIIVSSDRDGNSYFELDLEIEHPLNVSGKSEFAFMGVPLLSLQANNGQIIMDSTIPFIEQEVMFDGSQTTTLKYTYRDRLTRMRSFTETWRDLLDNQIVVNSRIGTVCEVKITSPENDQQLTYNSDQPGELKFTAKARISGPWEDELEHLVWDFPQIGESELTTDPEDARGPVVEVIYTGLPENNEDFGEHTIRAYFESETICSDPEPVKIKVFFPRDEYNNPYSISGGAVAGPGQGGVPNWFWYWSQTSAAQGLTPDQIRYDGAGGAANTSGNTNDTVVLGYYNGYVVDNSRHPDANAIYVCDLGQVNFINRGLITKVKTEGIDTFATTVRHEMTHMDNYHAWWAPESYRRQKEERDKDRDFVPDELEPGLGLNPSLKDTHKTGMDDEEYLAYSSEARWAIGSANSEDWADPGKQTKGDG